MSTNVCAKFRSERLGIFKELITKTRRRTTRLAFWDPPSGSKNTNRLERFRVHQVGATDTKNICWKGLVEQVKKP